MKNYYHKVACLILWGCICLSPLAAQIPEVLGNRNQTPCSDLLTQAQEDYKKGKIWEVESEAFQNCLQGADGFSKLEKIQAYRLLTLVALFQENSPKAETYIRKLLALDPEFRLSPFDPPEFRNLYEKFKVRPLYALRLQMGPNGSLFRVGQVYGIDNTQNANGPLNPHGNRSPRLGGQISAGIDIFLPNPHWEFGFELGLVRNLYRYEHQQETFVSGSASPFAQLDFSENQNWGTASFLVRYNFLSKKKVQENPRFSYPYLLLGPQFQFLLSSEIDDITRRTFDGGQEVASPVSGLTQKNLRDLRQGYNGALIVALGYNLKVRRHDFFVEARLAAGLTNIVRTDNRYANEVLVYKYGYVDPDLFLNLAMINIGYRFSFYQIQSADNS